MARLVSTLDRLSCWSTALPRLLHFSVILACPQRSQMASIRVKAYNSRNYARTLMNLVEALLPSSETLCISCPAKNFFACSTSVLQTQNSQEVVVKA